MSFQLNQFKLTDQVGEVMNTNPSTISARCVSTLSGTLKAGDAVKLSPAEAGQLPVIDKAASADQAMGVVLFNAKKATYAANDVVEIGISGTIVTMAANGALNRQTAVSWNSVAGQIQSTTTNYLGYTLDVASTAGDIVRVYVQSKIL